MWLSSKSIQKAFTKSAVLKLGSLALVLLLLVAAGFGVWKAFSMPAEREEPVTLVSYQHQGEFDYLVYIEPTHLFGPPPAEGEEEETRPLYFTNIIEDIEVSFTYRFDPDYPAKDVSSDVDIVAIITGPSRWEKEVPVKSATERGDSFTISFPLELDEFNEEINTIEEELGVRYRYVEVSVYTLVIEARVKVKANTGTEWIEETFIQPMEIKVGTGTLEWDNELNLVQRSSQGGFSYKQVGNFDYTIWLEEETTLYGSEVTTLSPEPYQPPPIISQPPGEVHFPKIVDIMKTSFSYRFICNQPVTNLVEEVTVTATLEYPGMWSKTFTLIPKTSKSGEFVLYFPVDINYFNEMVSTIRDEIGMGAATHNLTIEAEVHTTADTQFGHIDEVFTHTLDGTLGMTTITWGDELVKSQPGTIDSTRIVTNPNVVAYRILSPVALVLILFGFLFLGWNASQARLVMSRIEEEAFRARKKYKNVIVDVGELPIAKAEETVITCGSVDELVKAADALLKPVLHQAGADKHTYCAIDGLTRYEYVSYLQPQDASSVRVPDEGNG